MRKIAGFLFPVGRQPLSMDLFRVVFVFAVFLVFGWLWNDYTLPLVGGCAFLGVTLVKHLWWHTHPKGPTPPTPTTRYNAEFRGDTWRG
jgi:hypothetical protein